MADTKISAMSAATAATASTVPVVQGGVNKKVAITGAGAAMIEAANAAAQAALLTSLMPKAGSAFTGLTGAGFRDTSAAYDVTMGFASSTALDGARSLTWDVKNASHTLKFTGASTVTFPEGTNTLHGSGVANTTTLTGLGTTPTAGLSLINTTAAANGAQQVSPSLVFQGNAYTGAASQTTAWRVSALPYQAATPDVGLIFAYQINGGAWVDQMRLNANDQVKYQGLAFAQTFNLIPSLTSDSTKLYISPTQIALDLGSLTRFTVGSGDSSLSMHSTYAIGFASGTSGANDAFFKRKGAAAIQMGADAAGVTNQMFTAASRITSDGVGANLTIAGGNGRGGAGGSLILATYTTAGAATIGTLTTRLTLDTAGLLTFADAVDMAFNATTGTKIGTATTQKIGFWNAAPVVQPVHIADPSGGAIQDAEARTAIAAINAMLAATGLTAAS